MPGDNDFKFTWGQRVRLRDTGELGYAYDYEPGPGRWIVCYMDVQGGCSIEEHELEAVPGGIPDRPSSEGD